MLNSKLKGNFYTPNALAEWIVFYLSDYFVNKVDVLEPSCGNGVFINALDNSTISLRNFDAVELDIAAIDNIKRPSNIKNIKIFNDDFLCWESKTRYDLVIGNPPYIVRKRLKDNQSNICKEIHVQHGLLNYEIANIWTSFLLRSTDFLKEDGVLAFVLPTEILQVKYAEEIRLYLSKNFSRIELITFKQLSFDGILQDTVVLIAYKNKKSKENGVFIIEVDSIGVLSNTIPNFTHLPPTSLNQKWTTGILQEEDILLVNDISTKIYKANHYCSSVAGIVTAANDFFIFNQSKSNEFTLESFGKKIIRKGFFVNGCVDFTMDKYQILQQKNIPCFLLDTNGKDDLPKGLSLYLKHGESLKIHDRFKCKLRKRWHDVPGIKKSEGFFFKRSHDYPKCIKNSADVLVTDSAYHIVMNGGYTIDNFVFSFYNSLTLLAAEMQGRYYGGGVLELTPNEFKNLPIPYTQCENFTRFSELFEKKTNFDNILFENDQIILSDKLGLSKQEVKQIHNSYKRMKSRRMRSS